MHWPSFQQAAKARQSICDVNYCLNKIKSSVAGDDYLNESLRVSNLFANLSSTTAYNRSESIYSPASLNDDTTTNTNSKSKSVSELLDQYYDIVNSQLIKCQSPTTGLFPIYSKRESNYGHVRDTIYCATAVWSLRQCFCKIDSDKGRTYHLGQMAVKAMRDILFCWMKQAHKIEKFKANPLPENALHSKFNIITGEEVADKNYGQLQLNCVALYLITLAQMTSSGLQVRDFLDCR